MGEGGPYGCRDEKGEVCLVYGSVCVCVYNAKVEMIYHVSMSDLGV